MPKQVEFVLQNDQGLLDPRKWNKKMKMRNTRCEWMNEEEKKQVLNVNEQVNKGWITDKERQGMKSHRKNLKNHPLMATLVLVMRPRR